MTGRALLIGSSYSAAPLFYALKRRGFHVTVCGARREDPCHRYADHSEFFDYSSVERLNDFLERERFDFIVPSCNDFAYLSGSAAAEAHGDVGFDPYERSLDLHTKGRFRSICEAHSIPSPKRYYAGIAEGFDPEAFPAGYPVLVKPADSFSGRGMSLHRSRNGLAEAIQSAAQSSRSGEIVIEQYVEANFHSHTAFYQRGEFVWDGFVDEFCVAYPYQVDCSNYPSLLPLPIKEGARATMLRLARELNLADGLIHTQFLSDGKEFWILETMRRCPGDLYGNLIERATGVPYTDMYLCKFLGETYPATDFDGECKFFGRHTLSVRSPVVASRRRAGRGCSE